MRYAIPTLVLLAACASATTEHFPEASNPFNAATVTVYRTGDVFGSATRMDVQLDGYTIAKLRPGSHVRFTVDAGQHSVGTNHSSASLEFAKGQEYVFQIDLDLNGGHSVRRISPEEWAKRRPGSTAVR